MYLLQADLIAGFDAYCKLADKIHLEMSKCSIYFVLQSTFYGRKKPTTPRDITGYKKDNGTVVTFYFT